MKCMSRGKVLAVISDPESGENLCRGNMVPVLVGEMGKRTKSEYSLVGAKILLIFPSRLRLDTDMSTHILVCKCLGKALTFTLERREYLP
jgi:hypothetical protein